MLRENLAKTLRRYYDFRDEPYPSSIFIWGNTTGKSFTLNQVLPTFDCKFVSISCIECCTSRNLFETIINSFRDHRLSLENNFSPYKRLDSMMEFVEELQRLDADGAYIIVLDDAERLRDMEFNILPVFMRLQEETGLNISTIFVTKICYEKFIPKGGMSEPLKIFVPPYDKRETTVIMMMDYSNAIVHLQKQFENEGVDTERRLELISKLDEAFYENYLSIFLNVFYKTCRDLNELRFIAAEYFEVYCQPIFEGTAETDDMQKLWRHIARPLRIAMARIYSRIEQSKESKMESSESALQSVKKQAQTLELPYYAKYLLISGFLASHNQQKNDKRLFMKHHGKQKKRMQNVKAKAKLGEKTSIQVGPKAFNIDRLLAIFYAILDEKVGLSVNLLAQISTLIQLKLFTIISGESNIMDGSARLQCNVSFDFIVYLGQNVGFNVKQYLLDA